MDIMGVGISQRVAKEQAKEAAFQATRPYGYEEVGDRAYYIPQFEKISATPIMTATQAGLSSIYWPKIVEAHLIFPNPKGKYYMYFSTNHASGAGGIAMAYADKPTGPYTMHGLVYSDSVEGDQTETPRFIYNEKTQELFMYYQNAGVGIGQSTLLAITKDGINFTRWGVVLDRPDRYPGDGHTGYFAPFRIGESWYGHSLMGGGDYGRKTVSYSEDGKLWYNHPMPLMGGNDATRSYQNAFSRSNSAIFKWRGTLWWVGMLTSYASGGAAASAVPAIAEMSRDLRQLLNPPVPCLPMPSLPWETANIQSMSITIIEGEVYLLYNVDKNVGIAKMKSDRGL